MATAILIVMLIIFLPLIALIATCFTAVADHKKDRDNP